MILPKYFAEIFMLHKLKKKKTKPTEFSGYPRKVTKNTHLIRSVQDMAQIVKGYWSGFKI